MGERQSPQRGMSQLEIDQRIKAAYVSYPSAGGNAGAMRGYLVQPAGPGPFPAVLVVHENRSLNPYIEAAAKLSWTRTIEHFRKYLV